MAASTRKWKSRPWPARRWERPTWTRPKSKGVKALASEQTELKWGTETGPQTARDGFKALLDAVSAELQECRTALEQALTDSRRAMAGYEANEEDITARLASAFPGEAYGAGPQAVGDGTADYGAH